MAVLAPEGLLTLRSGFSFVNHLEAAARGGNLSRHSLLYEE